MATASSPKNDRSKEVDAATAFVFDFDPNNCPDIVDPSVLFCPTDDGCEWHETCTEKVVCINGINYFTWRPKGLQPDSFDCYVDPGIHLHIACNQDGLVVRLTGEDILNALFGLQDDELIQQFCEWLLDNCFLNDRFMDWICDTIINHCLSRPGFADIFCEWFIFTVLERPECKQAFIQWLIDNFLNDPDTIERLCEILAFCLENTQVIRDLICDIIKECLAEDQDLRNLICDIIIECFDRQDVIDKLCDIVEGCLELDSIQDRICEIVKVCLDNQTTRDLICDIIRNDCIVTCQWNSNTEPDPQGTSCDGCTHMIDIVTGCITHLCIDGQWVCV